MVQHNTAFVITGTIKGTSRDSIYRQLDLESLAERRWPRKTFFFLKIINLFYLYIDSHILDTMVKEFIKQDQQIKTILDNSLLEQQYLSHLFFLIVLKSGIILVRTFKNLNQQFILKRKFSVSSDPKKTQFLRFMTNWIKLLNRLKLHYSHLNRVTIWININFGITLELP